MTFATVPSHTPISPQDVDVNDNDSDLSEEDNEDDEELAEFLDPSYRRCENKIAVEPQPHFCFTRSQLAGVIQCSSLY